MKGYVVYQGRRYRIVGIMPSEGTLPDQYHRYRLRPYRGPDVIAPADQVKPWKRGSVRRLNGHLPHRQGRPVSIAVDTATEIITTRLKGTRRRFTCTFGGLYDLLARQQVLNTKRDRAFARRTRRRK